jgi:hypothetical protein
VNAPLPTVDEAAQALLDAITATFETRGTPTGIENAATMLRAALAASGSAHSDDEAA